MPDNTGVLTEIQAEVLEGLLEIRKRIPTKYFYDTEGSRIFQQIMKMPEYYLTSAETEVLELHREQIVNRFCDSCETIDLVELGAGDGLKTRILIGELFRQDVSFRYIPIDISGEAVDQLSGSMKEEYPGLSMEPRIGDYFRMTGDLSRVYSNRKIIMFLGSNLGNFSREESLDFLGKLHGAMSGRDLLFLGLDLKKDPDVIRQAYDDPHGHTRDFNLNLLRRMNREMGADFDASRFRHAPVYDPSTGIASSYLVSTEDQSVRFEALENPVRFRRWEAVFTEMSCKYDGDSIRSLAAESGFEQVGSYTDRRNYFINLLWMKNDRHLPSNNN